MTLPQQIRSDDGAWEITITEEIQPLKNKSDHEHVAVYKGRHKDQDIIVKVFLLSASRTLSSRAANEIAALRHLANANCQYSPHYLGDFRKTLDGLTCHTEHFVLMTFCPGQTVSAMDEQEYAKEYTEIRQAFREAIREVHGCGVDNGSHHTRNVVYDKQEAKCYIIDFERAEFSSADSMPKEWGCLWDW